MGLALMCVHFIPFSSSKYTNLVLTLSGALGLKIMMIKSFTFKNEFDSFFSFTIYLCFFRALLDSPAFAALANRWCRYCLIDCYRDGACFHFRFSSQRAMMFLASYIAIVG